MEEEKAKKSLKAFLEASFFLFLAVALMNIIFIRKCNHIIALRVSFFIGKLAYKKNIII